MEKLFQNKTFVKIARIVLGAIFVYASFDKMANPQDFLKVIENYKILPVQLANPLAIFLPWLELITGLLLIVGKWEKGALLIYNVLMVIFVIALSQALIRGLDISCGCFSVKPTSTSEVWLRVILDIITLFFSVNLYRYYPENENLELANTKT
ncbi:MAG TPA: MauE/DoxX family redox-associated membrane protein [Ignavibacteria bacterium]|nr:MauE/DoxX family redox-associated membrane protein [Ignavibacteria bacterium]